MAGRGGDIVVRIGHETPKRQRLSDWGLRSLKRLSLKRHLREGDWDAIGSLATLQYPPPSFVYNRR